MYFSFAPRVLPVKARWLFWRITYPLLDSCFELLLRDSFGQWNFTHRKVGKSSTLPGEFQLPNLLNGPEDIGGGLTPALTNLEVKTTAFAMIFQLV